MHWLYVPQDNTSWAWCPSTDLNCYILPVGNCMINANNNKGSTENPSRNEIDQGIRDYLLRFRHEVRWRIQNATEQLAGEHTLDNCTAIHVRRGDSALNASPYRRYAGLSEYLEAGNVGQDKVILLLTDDWTTIYEAEHFYPDYKFIYMHRPRVNITYGGFDGHIPSGDAASDFVAIQAETTAVARCQVS
jgi:hypothetical protein